MEKDSKWYIIRIVDDGEEDYPYLSDLYKKSKYNKIAHYLQKWDYGDYTESTDEPKLALYDRVLSIDDVYKLIYNASIGGTFALFAKPNL